ncbi:reverse transcriptase domain-containing protein, partial [Klebsiella pneumoniae]|uniref:reverse transcriptase domain-containing protein n=1 Tax=Klebsiella pneumoniae TaxID=573 RepID=UPI0040554C61
MNNYTGVQKNRKACKSGRTNSGQKKVRMVIDYRKLNEMTVNDKYPLPNIEDLLNKLQNAKIFSTIDLASGF